MAKSKKNKTGIPKLLYLGSGFFKSECGKVIEYSGYNGYTQHFTYENYYIASREIINYILDNDANVVIGEGLGGFFAMFVSNENTPDDSPLIYRILINPILQPAEDLAEIQISENVTSTYSTIESNVYRQKYIDTRHSVCVFSKDNIAYSKYYEDFTKKTGIPCIVVDTLDNEFIFTNLQDIVNTVASGKDITKYINK